MQPIRDSVDWLEANGYTEQADRVVLGLEKAGYPCSTWLREVSSMKRATLVAFADKYTESLEDKEDQSRCLPARVSAMSVARVFAVYVAVALFRC